MLLFLTDVSSLLGISFKSEDIQAISHIQKPRGKDVWAQKSFLHCIF